MIYLNKKPLLEDSFNSFVRSIDIVYTLTESYPIPAKNREEKDNYKKDESNDPWVREILKSHYNDIKDIKQTTDKLKDLINSNKNQNQYEREMDNKRFEDLKNVSYEPMTVTKQNRPFTSYPFPFNILYLAKQIFI